MVVSCRPVDLPHFAVGELVVARAGYSVGQFDVAVDEDDVGVLQTMRAALCHLDEVDLLFDPAPHIGRNVGNADLFGQLDHQRQHFPVNLGLEGLIPLHEFFDADEWEAMKTGH